jgi:hypothetical protein
MALRHPSQQNQRILDSNTSGINPEVLQEDSVEILGSIHPDPPGVRYSAAVVIN